MFALGVSSSYIHSQTSHESYVYLAETDGAGRLIPSNKKQEYTERITTSKICFSVYPQIRRPINSTVSLYTNHHIGVDYVIEGYFDYPDIEYEKIVFHIKDNIKPIYSPEIGVDINFQNWGFRSGVKVSIDLSRLHLGDEGNLKIRSTETGLFLGLRRDL
ncbi:hypothetical protein QA601_03760 [Chitinispirillales bacterium ANBcel5]|uniref:hypothetical protein n=1 Tax=Cellulosispirillum alkaliphilum TaxID=3039283 RepID=UPI002A577468|nr:hypothetical protein [Chitinispirillales bacterium ANBcel5]